MYINKQGVMLSFCHYIVVLLTLQVPVKSMKGSTSILTVVTDGLVRIVEGSAGEKRHYRWSCLRTLP